MNSDSPLKFVQDLAETVLTVAIQSSSMICTEPGCGKPVSKAGYKFCYEHYRKAKQYPSKPQSPSAPDLLSATKISAKLSLPQNKVNPILAELGWLSKNQNGWVATPQGLALGAVQKTHTQDNGTYVLWPESILTNKAFLATIQSLNADASESNVAESSSDRGFRERFRAMAKHRTTDGHWVRSKAEVLIDNWLYVAGLVHAYERQIPIEEEMYCDFYVPAGKVYIEYWGYENDSEYTARKKVKQELYQKYNLNLIELSDEHVRNLDDFLPKMLLKFGVVVS